ncbi:MAG: helix-turn-helix domain-containing protein, partial [Ruminiclostridium sp.]|nr:helix-turn-helix domain-containing protein [Ruminiclostridium sp.]
VGSVRVVYQTAIMPHIARLREKLGEPARKPEYVKSVWGVGYKIEQ